MTGHYRTISHAGNGAQLNMSEADIAASLGITRGAVWIMERRAIRRLWRDHRKLQACLVAGRRWHQGGNAVKSKISDPSISPRSMRLPH